MPIDARRAQAITDITDAANTNARTAWLAVETARTEAASTPDAELPAKLAELSTLITAADAAELEAVQLADAAAILKG